MEVKLIGAIDYKKLEEELIKRKADLDIIDIVKGLEVGRRSEIVASAGRLSRFMGNVFEILQVSENKTLEENCKFINNVISMGHDSITDHDYFVFAIKDVSIMLEQEIIKERFAGFTIKSRREVDFSSAGIYVPDFHDKSDNILNNNFVIKREYNNHMNMIFDFYKYLMENGISNEDARFVMPYCTNSNIFMTIDAHTLKDMIIKFTKRKYSKISELREFGEKLREISLVDAPYLKNVIDKENVLLEDKVDSYLSSKISDDNQNYQVIKKACLLNRTANLDDTILIASIMRRFQLDRLSATRVYNELSSEDKNFKRDLMRHIAYDSDGLELTQVNFDFQIPCSLAVLTHLTRHRTHHIMLPDLKNVDLRQYKTPPKINGKLKVDYDNLHKLNYEMYRHVKDDYGVREEDLLYFLLCGNMVNVMTNIDGFTLKHILELRKCNKSQWETRGMAYGMHDEIKKLEDAKLFSSILGPTCETQNICREKRECCGKILKLRSQK